MSTCETECVATLTLGGATRQFPAPLLIVSTTVGRGMYSLGEAIRERFSGGDDVRHAAVEDMLPSSAVHEDLVRYKLISNYAPWSLTLPYKVPFFYRRKFLRESSARTSTDLAKIARVITSVDPATVLCVSHRPAFWLSCFKKRTQYSFRLWGVLGEYGCTLGWKYIFWEQMNGFLSPLSLAQLDYPFPNSLEFVTINLPARSGYYELARCRGDSLHVLVVCGYWGQGPITRVLRTLKTIDSRLRLTVICGENASEYQDAIRIAHGDGSIAVHGVVDSLVPYLQTAGAVITKPGISTILEAHAAGRKIFLLPGMPVAETNNARYAIENFGAEWFAKRSFASWLTSAGV